MAAVTVAPAVSPTAIPYGNRFVGTITASQVVTVTNLLTVPVQIKSIAVTGGPAPADYPIGIMCPLARPLAAGQSCSVNVRFRPTSVGINSASLLVTDSASNSVSVALTGVGVAAVTVAPGNLTFASQPVGTPSSPITITLTNAFTSKLSFSSIAASGDFAVSSNTCASGVAPSKPNALSG